MIISHVVDSPLGDCLEFEFLKGVPGDIYRFRNCVEIPSVFGLSIQIIVEDYGFFVVVEDVTNFDEVIDYVTSHKRNGHNLYFYKERFI